MRVESPSARRELKIRKTSRCCFINRVIQLHSSLQLSPGTSTLIRCVLCAYPLIVYETLEEKIAVVNIVDEAPLLTSNMEYFDKKARKID